MFEKEEIIPLEEEVFRLIRDFVRDYCGIYFDDDYGISLRRGFPEGCSCITSATSGNITGICSITGTAMKSSHR
jgi:hypothetical protein